MAGLDRQTPVPIDIVVHATSRVLELRYDDGGSYRLPFEFLRVQSPSAEVRGHGPGQEVLQTGKRDVTIRQIEPVGNYAIRPVFSDGHSSGIYSWDYLWELARRHDELWRAYLDRLAAAGASRDAPPAVPAPASADSAAVPPAAAASDSPSAAPQSASSARFNAQAVTRRPH